MLSTTLTQQPRSGRRRQPFGFLSANTLSDTTENGGVGSSNSGSINVPKKNNMRGIFKSIVTRSKGRKNERSSTAAVGEEGDVSMMESPAKKTRNMIMMKTGDNTDTTKFGDSTGITNNVDNAFNFDANDVQHIFRPLVSAVSVDAFCWDDDMEDMLELKQANPISEESMFGIIEDTNAERSEVGVDISNVLTAELDENVSGVPILWSHQVEEDKDISTALVFDANDVKPIFRPKCSAVSISENDEMVDLLTLKQANPISECVDEETNAGGSERRADAFNSLSKELGDENDGSTGVHILWSTRVKEDKDGFKKHIDPRTTV